MEARRKWADSESDEEEVEPTQERIITSLPSLDTQAKTTKPKKKVKVRKEEPEEKLDPNLVTKLSTADSKPKPENKNLRPNGTTASKKEIKEKELEELNKLLADLGVTAEPTAEEEEQKKNQKELEKNSKNKKPKSSKKELFENVRSEIVARTEKSKKNKKKNNFTNFK